MQPNIVQPNKYSFFDLFRQRNQENLTNKRLNFKHNLSYIVNICN